MHGTKGNALGVESEGASSGVRNSASQSIAPETLATQQPIGLLPNEPPPSLATVCAATDDEPWDDEQSGVYERDRARFSILRGTNANNRIETWTGGWDDLGHVLRRAKTYQRVPEPDPGLGKNDPAYKDAKESLAAFCPAVFSREPRREENVTCLETAIPIDFDGQKPGYPAQVFAHLRSQDVAFTAHTSTSHMLDGQEAWRLCFRPSRRWTKEEHKPLVNALIQRFELRSTARPASQPWFLPARRGEHAPAFESHDGTPVDIDAMLTWARATPAPDARSSDAPSTVPVDAKLKALANAGNGERVDAQKRAALHLAGELARAGIPESVISASVHGAINEALQRRAARLGRPVNPEAHELTTWCINTALETQRDEAAEKESLLSIRGVLGAFAEQPSAAGSDELFPFLSPDTIEHDLPPMSWLVEGLQLGPGRVAMLAGYGASAKTLSAQSLAISVIAGVPVWGRFTCAGGATVVHADFEMGARATISRYQRLARAMGVPRPRLREHLRLSCFPRLRLSQNHAEVRRVLTQACQGAQLLIVDSLRASVNGVDENDSEMRTYLDVLTQLSERIPGLCVLVLHHARKDSLDSSGDSRAVLRGSGAIFDACGTVLVISAKDSVRTVKQAKSAGEAHGGMLRDFELAVEDVADGQNLFAGLRVVARDRAAPENIGEAECTALIDVVRSHPEGVVISQITKTLRMGKNKISTLVETLVLEGRLVESKEARAGKSRAVYRVPTPPDLDTKTTFGRGRGLQ